LGNVKYSGGDKSGEYGGLLWVVTLFGGQKLANTCSFMGGRIIVQTKNIETGNPFSESEELHSWRCPKILLSFLM
jgi:hypothetical protein